MASYCPRCQDNWYGGYHICPDSTLTVAIATEPAKPQGTGSQEFVKHDKDKTDYSQIPPGFEEAIAKVLTIGAAKYSPDNWKLCSNPWPRYYAALRRHLDSAARGLRTDSDSGESHLAHAACCLAFLWWFEREGRLEAAGAGGKDSSEPSPAEPGQGVGAGERVDGRPAPGRPEPF